jgi:hypothetical protein
MAAPQQYHHTNDNELQLNKHNNAATCAVQYQAHHDNLAHVNLSAGPASSGTGSAEPFSC